MIDETLKHVYDQAIDKGVPDRFRVLLDALKEQEQHNDTGK